MRSTHLRLDLICAKWKFLVHPGDCERSKDISKGFGTKVDIETSLQRNLARIQVRRRIAASNRTGPLLATPPMRPPYRSACIVSPPPHRRC